MCFSWLSFPFADAQFVYQRADTQAATASHRIPWARKPLDELTAGSSGLQASGWAPTPRLAPAVEVGSAGAPRPVSGTCGTGGAAGLVGRQLPPAHLYMTIGKTIALTRQTFVGKVMSLLFNNAV